MTLDEALALREGDRVASPHDTPPYRVRRITRPPWRRQSGNDVRISMASYCNGDWVSPFGFVLVPKGAKNFDTTGRRWMRPATKAEAISGQSPAFVPVGDPVPVGSCVDPGGAWP